MPSYEPPEIHDNSDQEYRYLRDALIECAVGALGIDERRPLYASIMSLLIVVFVIVWLAIAAFVPAWRSRIGAFHAGLPSYPATC